MIGAALRTETRDRKSTWSVEGDQYMGGIIFLG